jgi:hypothetical protein
MDSLESPCEEKGTLENRKRKARSLLGRRSYMGKNPSGESSLQVTSDQSIHMNYTYSFFFLREETHFFT